MRVIGYGDRRRSGVLLAVRSLRLLGDVDPRAVEGSDRETAGVDLQAGSAVRQVNVGVSMDQPAREENGGSEEEGGRGVKRTMGRVVLTKV